MADTQRNGPDMTLDDYQVMATETATYPGRGEHQLVYPVIAMAGEAGELAEVLLGQILTRRTPPHEYGVGPAALIVVAECGTVMERIKKVYRNEPRGALSPERRREILDAIQSARSALAVLGLAVESDERVEFPSVAVGTDVTEGRLIKEAGDVLWYVACFCTEARVALGHVAEVNYAKLADRMRRDVIRGDGDDR